VTGSIFPIIVVVALLIAGFTIYGLTYNDPKTAATAPATTTGQGVPRPAPMKPNENYK
jgi:hypothetical protein